MTKETKQDVFEETLSNLKKMDAQIEGEWGYSQLTMGVGKHGDVESTREIAIAEIRARYAAASDETPEQSACPYCHESLRMLGDSEDDEIVLQQGNLHVAMTVPVGFDNGCDEEDVSINFCPMCGRKLVVEDE